MNEEHTLSLRELGEVKTIKVYNQAYVDKQQKQIEELKAQIEKMKCCSMCKYYDMNFLPYFCIKNNDAPHCTSKCDKWEIKENELCLQ